MNKSSRKLGIQTDLPQPFTTLVAASCTVSCLLLPVSSSAIQPFRRHRPLSCRLLSPAQSGYHSRHQTPMIHRLWQGITTLCNSASSDPYPVQLALQESRSAHISLLCTNVLPRMSFSCAATRSGRCCYKNPTFYFSRYLSSYLVQRRRLRRNNFLICSIGARGSETKKGEQKDGTGVRVWTKGLSWGKANSSCFWVILSSLLHISRKQKHFITSFYIIFCFDIHTCI
jgi:hypothetical protein